MNTPKSSTPDNRPAKTESDGPQGRFLRVFCFLMACGVGFGAFGAHAIKGMRSEAQLETWKTATLYLLIHALAGALFSIPRVQLKVPRAALVLFLAGSVIFAGSLYALVLTQITLLGAITPFGGLMFIAGWITLALRTRIRNP